MSRGRKPRINPTTGAMIGGQWHSWYALGERDAEDKRTPAGGWNTLTVYGKSTEEQRELGVHLVNPRTYYEGYMAAVRAWEQRRKIECEIRIAKQWAEDHGLEPWRQMSLSRRSALRTLVRTECAEAIADLVRGGFHAEARLVTD